MIKHIVMFKLANPSQSNIIALKDTLMSMQGKIPCVIELKVGMDVLRSPRSMDVVLECTLKNLDDLEIYRNHPAHIPVMQYVQSVTSAVYAVDYFM